MKRVIFERRTGGLNRQLPSEDGISGLVASGAIAVGSSFALNKTYEFRSLRDAEKIGIDTAYDDTNDILIHYHISEFFRLSPSGILYFMGVADSVSMEDICDKANSYAAKLLLDAKGKIRQVGIMLNPATGYTPTITNGLDNDVYDAIAKADALAIDAETSYRPVDFILEGRAFSGDPAELTDLHTLDKSNVSVTILQDSDIASLKAEYADYASVGTVLGLLSSAKVNENIGWAEKFNIQDEAAERYLNPGLSSGDLLSEVSEDDLDTLDEKGYIIPEIIIGSAGVFISDTYTCIALDSDFCYIENNRTIKKAIRLVYTRLAPKVKRPIKVDKSTGQLPTEVCKYFQSEAKSALEVMLRGDECSDVDAFVNPAQNILSTSELVVEIEVTPTGTARKIRVPIGFNNPFKS